jgi:hypothetical protein
VVTKDQADASYHCGIGDLLKAAYGREFTMLEMGRCKMKFVTFQEWYETLNPDQRDRVDAHLSGIYDR